MLSWPDEAIPTANAKLEPEPRPLEALIKIPANLAAPRIAAAGHALALKAERRPPPASFPPPPPVGAEGGGGGGCVIGEIWEERTRQEGENEKVFGAGDGD